MINTNYKKDISKYFKVTPKKPNQRLIDPATGDIYEYDFDLKKWNPKINAG